MAGMEQDTFVEYRVCDLDELREFPGNAQVGNIPEIVASLKKSGQYRALIVRELDDGALVVMAGNHTAKALRALGQRTARCEIHHCDDIVALRINIADNGTQRGGRTDNDLLIEQLSYFDDDLVGTGYDQAFIDLLLDGAAVGERPDEKPPPSVFPSYDDDLPTEHTCPRCSYSWSGRSH